MQHNSFCPYIHVAMRSWLEAPFHIRRRVLYDYELIYVEEGSFILTVEDVEYLCREGDCILLRPGVPHSFQSLPGVPLSQPHVHFDLIYDDSSPNITVSYKDKEEMSAEQRAMIRPDIFPPFPVVSPAPLSFKERLMKVIDTYESYPNSLECMANMLLLLNSLVPIGEKEQEGNLRGVERRAQEVKQYLDHNYHHVVTLQRLSALFNYNEDYLAKQFKRRYGVSPIRYYNELRRNEACRVLEEGWSVTETAEWLGFSSLYAFSRFFRQQLGVSPREWKERRR